MHGWTVFARIDGLLYEYNFTNANDARSCVRYWNLGENSAYALPTYI